MSFSLADLKNELDTIINGATNTVDLADKTAQAVGKYGEFIPVVGPEVKIAVDALNGLDAALHTVKSALGLL
jgi:hypothetical protein